MEPIIRPKHDTAGTDGLNQKGERRRIQPCRYSRVIFPLPNFLHFSPNGARSLAGGLSSTFWEYSMLYFGTDILKPVFGAV